MKHLFVTALSLITIAALSAQSPVYVLFNANCMKQLEYKKTRSGESVYAYSYQPNPDEQYLFMSGSGALPTPSLPEGTLDCNTLNITDDAVRIINEQTQSRQMYVVIQQRTSGYLMMPVYSAIQMKRYGSWYLLVGPKFTFAIDTTKLSYSDNLQGESSPSVIRFTGSQLANCRYQYKFHGEPARGYTESMDFDFIAGLGIVNYRIGSNPSELSGSEMRLANIDGRTYDSYLADICHQSNQQVNTDYSTPQWTNQAGYNTGGELNKEDMSAGGWQQSGQNTGGWQQPPTTSAGKWQTGGNVGNPGGVSTYPSGCPTPFGKGYHVVQRGESLKAISRTYNVDLKSIIRWNNIKNPDHIEVCQQIWLQQPPKSNTTSKGEASTQNNYNVKKDGPTVVNQWNAAGNQQYYAPSNYNYTSPNRTQGFTGNHLIQRGETLSGIARRYNCPEECVRLANNMPRTGDVMIKAGETLQIPDCTCQMGSTYQQPNTYNYNAPRTSIAPPQVSSALNTQTQAPAPQVYEYQNPNAYNETSVAGQNQGQTNQQQNSQEPPPTQEYIVRQGETMNSIAIKHKMSVAELSALNSIAQDEKLVPGRRLVVRKYGN